MDLWFGSTKLTTDHQLKAIDGKYYLTEYKGSQYVLPDGKQVSLTEVDRKLKNGSFDYVTLDDVK